MYKHNAIKNQLDARGISSMVRNCAWNGKIYGHIRTLINTYKVINNNMLILHSLICVIMYWMNMKDFDRKIARTLGAGEGGGLLSLTRLGGGNINFTSSPRYSTLLFFCFSQL